MAGRPGFAAAGRRFARIEAALNRRARRAEGQAAQRYATVASLLAPVDTGALSRSITPHDDGTVSIEGAAREYYDIVETGGEAVPGSHQAPPAVPTPCRRSAGRPGARDRPPRDRGRGRSGDRRHRGREARALGPYAA